MGLKKAYDELTDNPEFSSGLAISTGQSIKDGSGDVRLGVKSSQTQIFSQKGDDGASARMSFDQGNAIDIIPQTDTPFIIRDGEGSFDAVQYDTDSSAGVLRTPNAGIRVESDGGFGDNGLLLRYVSDTSRVQSRSGGAYADMTYHATLHNFSNPASNLRLATGQSIEDGSGTNRIGLASGATNLRDENGSNRITLNTIEVQLRAENGSPVNLFDQEGEFKALEYTTSSSAPGTLELTNAELHPNGNTIGTNATSHSHKLGDGNIYWIGDNSNDTQLPKISNNRDSDPTEIIAEDGAGNRTILT